MTRSRFERKRPSAAKASKAEAPPQKAGKDGKRKNPRVLSTLLSQGITHCELYLETASHEEVVKLFEESYCSSLVNFLLDLKKSTTKRLFEIVVRQKKRAYLNVISLYYYKDYLINPLPMTLDSEEGRDVPNLYAFLGMPREASMEEVKAAQKLLASSFAPDSFAPTERKSGEERFREVNDAFEVLKNPKKRKELDTLLPNVSYFYPRRDTWWLEAVNRLIS